MAAPTVVEAAAPAITGPAATSYDTGSIAWMLTSSALVLLMVPGLALFYGGMVRAKNVLNTFLLCMSAIGVIGIQWVAVGYAIAFGPSIINTSFGSLLGFDKSLVLLMAFNAADYGRMMMIDATHHNGIPELLFVMFQGKFAIITPALIIGALAERIRFGPFLLFSVLWATLVYDPVAHWVWNAAGWAFNWGVLDFAGGTVVHILAGVSALAVTFVVGPRKNYGTEPMPPHSLGLTLIGAGLLWFGWFGFNAGSAVAVTGDDLPIAGKVAALAFANTQIAAAAAAAAWMFAEWLWAGKPTILGFASGMVAGLVVITPCAGHVLPWHSIVLGGVGGVGCYFACKIKNLIRADDSLDAFGVHAVGGAIGAVLLGFFASRPEVAGLAQAWKQLVAVSVCAGFAFIASYVLALAIHKTIGLRATAADEETGLDIALHGEQGYHLGLTSVGLSPGETISADARATAVHAH